MNKTLKYCFNIFQKTLKLPVFLINIGRFYSLSIKIGIREIYAVEGIPYLRNNGAFEIKKHVKINSRYSVNPIGGQSFASFVVWKGGKLIIDEGAGISNSAIICSLQVYIGKNVIIGGDCKIYDTDFHSLEYDKRKNNEIQPVKKPIHIEEGVFIGGGSMILKGVTIGKYSIVGAGSVVSKSIPPGEIWAGNPARYIKKVNQGKLNTSE